MPGAAQVIDVSAFRCLGRVRSAAWLERRFGDGSAPRGKVRAAGAVLAIAVVCLMGSLPAVAQAGDPEGQSSDPAGEVGGEATDERPLVDGGEGLQGERDTKPDGESSRQSDGESDQDSDEGPGDDTADVDTDNTIDSAEDTLVWRLSADLRPFLNSSSEGRLERPDSIDEVGARIRLDATWGPTRYLHFGARLAGVCSSERCDGEFVLQSALPSSSGLRRGQVTLDQLYLHWFRMDRFDIAVGRLQTRFVLRGGVFARSLDRNDSNNVNVTWTDGFHGTYRGRNGWASNVIVQRNSRQGAGSVRHGSLDFEDDSARETYFLGFENIHPWGRVVQRGFDVSYLPASLLQDAEPGGRRDDYWGLVARLATRWELPIEGARLRAGFEVGYAPETPTGVASGLAGEGSVDGLAWNVVASLMDFSRGHSLGVNYGRTGAGWLLSPQFRPNDELLELRYQWRLADALLFESRLRRRQALEPTAGDSDKRHYDAFVRLTWRFSIHEQVRPGTG